MASVLDTERVATAGSAVAGERSPDRLALGTIALPVEHGGWSLVLEPAVLGLIAAPGLAGTLLAIGAVAAFLTHQPLKVLAGELHKRAWNRRAGAAAAFAIAYTFLATATILIAVQLSGAAVIVPLLVALPLAMVSFVCACLRRARSLLAELSAAAAMGWSAAAIAVAGGFSFALAFTLWAVMAARAVPSVLYVRARLRLDRGRDGRAGLSHLAHITAVLLVALLAQGRLISFLALVPFTVLWLRSVAGLSPMRKPARARNVGITEVFLGAATVLFLSVLTRAA